MYLVAVTVLVFVSAPNATEAQGNLVVNGGFDFNAAGWIITNVLGSGYESTKGNPPGDVALDSLSPSLSTDPTASQTITSLTPGTTYVVSGDYRNITDRGGGSPTDFSFGVSIDGVLLFEAAQQTPNNWRNFNFLYTATASSALLSLSAQINGTGVSYAIDNIAMDVPEPSSLWLMGVGGIASAMFFRNRRTACQHTKHHCSCTQVHGEPPAAP